ncbi:gluconokinase [Sphingomonas faeni]|uniref:gluconokinase n=1 Tax=Sphingomonas faeni TaxID=185950 RepID=UPI0020C7BC0E|nr:gluconokinase [Sphingomonas faeni]MCP8889979.1 gluconokinase [Sphingomonas faeni]
MPSAAARYAIVVMGVSGSGKSTIGAALAARLGCRFLEGDAFHTPQSVAKMRAGQPLDDQDRWPWLDRVAASLRDTADSDGVAVGACSALKRIYRDRLSRMAGIPLLFVFLDTTDQDELSRRLAHRSGHYMPTSLIASQLDTLEKPQADERALTLSAGLSPDRACDVALDWILRERPVHHEERLGRAV